MKCNSTYHSTIMESADVNSRTYIDFKVENNDKESKFQVDDHVRILNIKKVLQKITLQIGLNMCLRLKKLKILFLGQM